MDSKEDEEISIDFSKIKGFFKSDKKEDKKTEESSIKQEKRDDEEISIDFSKIKNFFKSDKEDGKTEHTRKPEHEKDENVELSLDFSKIKKFFKSGQQETRSDEEISVNWGKVIDFFKTYGIVFIALIPIVLSIYIRMQAGFLPFTDDWAANSVISGIRSQIRAGIDQQYPNLPDANKNALVETEFQKIISQGKQQIDQQIKATSDYFRTFFQDENGKNYMPDIDPYYWLRYSKNILERGNPGDILKDGKPYDNRQLAPIGRFVVPDMFHSYSWAYFHKFLHFFVPDLTLMRSGFYLVVFFSALCVLLVFLIAKKVAGNPAGFFAGMMMAVNGAFLTRTLHPDNDVWVVFFPLLITWLFVIIIETKNTFRLALLTLLAGFFTGLYTLAWSGWWHVFDFLLATLAITFLYLILINFGEIRSDTKMLFSNIAIRNSMIVGALYFFSTAAFTTLISGWYAFRNSFLGPFSFPSIKAPVTASLWPNVLTTVAELNEGSINGIINSVGGPFLFFISLLGLVLLISRRGEIKKFDFFYIIGSALFYGMYFLLRRIGFEVSVLGLLLWITLPILVRIGISVYKKDHYDFRMSILISLWVVSTIFASIKGIRFTLLLAPAFTVAFGVALGKIYIYLSNWLTKEFKVHKAIGSIVLIVMFLFVFYSNPTKAAINAASYDIPIVNDAWYNALTAIKQDSSENAIITSWWDFGHHFKAITDRRVTFDGTTQTSDAAHWVGKILMTDNEEQALGILRMLDCGSGSAFKTLYDINNDTHLSLRVLNKVISSDKTNAEKILNEYKFDKNQIEKIVSFTHCPQPPEAYFIASEDMVGKSGVWSHFGSWSFERADIWQNARKMTQEKAIEYMMEKFNYTKDRAENVYFEVQAITSDSEANAWVAPWPGYGGTMRCSLEENSTFACQPISIGKDSAGNDVAARFKVDTKEYEVYAALGNIIIKPSAVAFTTEKGLLKKDINGSNFGLGMTFVPISENELLAVLSSRELVGSMFTRMFYMQGHGLKYFKLFNHQRGLTGTDIYTYKVDWEGKNTTIVNEYADFFKKPVKEENTTKTIELKSNDTGITSTITNSAANVTD